jgi:hypothetical protein
MPRRRALGVLGATLVGLATGGTARSARTPLGAQAHWCHREVSRNGWRFCTPETEACFPTCCPQERTCSIGPRGSNGCPSLVSCCDPCNPHGSRPTADGGCAPGPVASHCPCKRGQKKCDAGRGHGVVCCEADEYCATSRKDEGSGHAVTGTCCKRGESFCSRGSRGASGGSPERAFCCPRGTRCCITAGVCCSRLTQTCERGGCRCKPGHTVRCGRHCCHPRRHKCCGGPHKRCVPLHFDCDSLVNT